jgi:hypothetical protein
VATESSEGKGTRALGWWISPGPSRKGRCYAVGVCRAMDIPRLLRSEPSEALRTNVDMHGHPWNGLLVWVGTSWELRAYDGRSAVQGMQRPGTELPFQRNLQVPFESLRAAGMDGPCAAVLCVCAQCAAVLCVCAHCDGTVSGVWSGESGACYAAASCGTDDWHQGPVQAGRASREGRC